MKKILFSFLTLALVVSACTPKDGAKTTTASSVKLPYEAGYTTDFNNNVPDSSLLVVLNSYKYWETGDMKAVRSTMGDSVSVAGSDGFRFNGLTDSLMKSWIHARDSMSSVVIKMDVWLKNHSLKDSMDFVNVWYKEIDTYKSGRVDSAYYEDDNGIKNGKINWFSSHKQKLALK